MKTTLKIFSTGLMIVLLFSITSCSNSNKKAIKTLTLDEQIMIDAEKSLADMLKATENATQASNDKKKL